MFKTIHTLPQEATNQHIKDTVLWNHSNHRTVSQRLIAYQQLHQKPDEALQTYNTRYTSFFNLAYPELELDNPLSRMHCIHYASNHHNTGNQGSNYNKNNQQDKPVNVSIILHGPVSKEQLYKIQEVLRHPSQYRDRIKPEDRWATGEYAKAFNKFCPKKVEVNKATIEEAVKYGHYLKRSEEDIAEAIDIYRMLGNDTFYGPEEEQPADWQEQPKQ